MLRSFPDGKALALLALHAFGGLIQKRVDGLVAVQALMNGQGIRIDGHFKMAKIIRRFSAKNGNGTETGKISPSLRLAAGLSLQDAVPRAFEISIPGLRDHEKWDPFWGGIKQCKCMVILKDFRISPL